MDLWYDAYDCVDMWIEKLPEPVTKSILDIAPGDVEIDDSSFMVYRQVQPDGGPSVCRVTYDSVFPDTDIEDSQWRQEGLWGTGVKVTINARVIFVVDEEEDAPC